MAIDNLTQFIDSIKALDKTNKRLFYNEFNAQQADAFALTQAEIDAKEAAYMTSLRTQAGLLFGITVPVNVTVNQIKTYLNNWIDDKAVKLQPLISGGNIAKFKTKQVHEADLKGGDVKAYLQQAVKIYGIYYKAVQ